MSGTVAITGATGFVGGHVVRAVAEAGCRIRILSRRIPVHPVIGDTHVDMVAGSMDDRAALARLVDGCQAVVNLAGLIKAPSASDFDRINARSVATLAEATAEAAPKARLVHLSSLAARAPELSDYAASKRRGEDLLAQAAEDRGAGLSWVTVRAPAVYGPGDRETLPIFRLARRRIIAIPGRADARISLIHVRDLAAAITELAGGAGRDHRIYEVDDGHGGYAWADIVDQAARAMGNSHAPRIVYLPASAVGPVAVFNLLRQKATGAAPMLTPGKLREVRHSDWARHEWELEKDADWRPGIGLQEGFEDTVNWYLSEGWL